jgi:hypothetical protein
MKELIDKFQDEPSGYKPVNTPEFIKAFVKFLKEVDTDFVTFRGNNEIGKQVVIQDGYFGSMYDIEVAYSPTHISVYTAHHHGFWAAPYLNLSEGHPEFERVKESLFELLYKVFGLK